jgi:hypothetical protein
MFHMFVQTDFLQVGGTIEHLTSSDGIYFDRHDTAIHSLPLSRESGIYDPHAAIIKNRKYIVYSGMSAVGRPDIFLAQSTTNTWHGPWKRVGRILDHPGVPFHNLPDYPDYEWGLEGAQLIELPSGLILLNAVCFLPEGIRGTRQRIFLAVSNNIQGPYVTIGPVILPKQGGYDSGENGHATGLIEKDRLNLFYQARVWGTHIEHPPWRYSLAQIPIPDLTHYIDKNIVLPGLVSKVSHLAKSKESLSGRFIRKNIKQIFNSTN